MYNKIENNINNSDECIQENGILHRITMLQERDY